MREELAASSLLDNEALTSNLDDEQAGKLLAWATAVLPLISDNGEVKEEWLDTIREILKQVNRYYSFSPEEESLKRREAVLEICKLLHKITDFFEMEVAHPWNYLLGTTDDSLIEKIRDSYDPGGRDEQ